MKEKLLERKSKLEQDLKNLEINYHRISGAIAFINEQLADLERTEQTEEKK